MIPLGPEQCCLLCPKIPNHLNLDFLRYIAVFCAERVENLQFDWSHIQNPQLTFAVWNEQESQPGSHPVRAAPSLQPRCLFQNSRQLARRWQKRYIHSPKAPSPASDRSQKARAARRGRRYFLGVKFRLRLVLVKSPQTLKSPSKKKEPPSDGVCKLAKSQGTIRWNKFSVPSDGFHHAVDKHLCRYLGHPYAFAAREACIDLVNSKIYPSCAEVQERIGTFLHSSGIQLWIQQANLAILAGEGLACLSPRTENRTHVSRRFTIFWEIVFCIQAHSTHLSHSTTDHTGGGGQQRSCHV